MGNELRIQPSCYHLADSAALMANHQRACMDHKENGTSLYSPRIGSLPVIDLSHALHLHEMIAAPYGADLIVRKRGEKIVVQAKRYEKNVGIAAVQEAVGSVAYYDADRAMVVTNSGFTKSARNLARQNDVELWGRYDIQKKFKIRE